MATLNLGILAHVDAGKTTLTERLLYAAGVIDDIGRVDHGTTQTDSLALERQRGITIKSAVVSFVVDGVIVNLIDTPGHPDFIAEVERVLEVLDGAVLVISAVEGVQSQTLVLHRALRRLGIPTVFFVNKIDRAGADERRVLDAIGERLAVKTVAMNVTRDVGTHGAGVVAWTPNDAGRVEALTEALAVNDDQILRRYLDGERMPDDQLHAALAAQTAARLVHPVYFGSAMTGAGTDELAAGVVGLLPTAARRRRRAAVGHGLQDRTGTERREARARPHVRGDVDDARSDPARRRRVRRRNGSPPFASSQHGDDQPAPLDDGRRDRRGPRPRERTHRRPLRRCRRRTRRTTRSRRPRSRRRSFPGTHATGRRSSPR